MENILGQNFQTLDEAAATLGICRQTLTRYIAQGRLATFRFGRRKLISEDELRRFVAAECHTAQPRTPDHPDGGKAGGR